MAREWTEMPRQGPGWADDKQNRCKMMRKRAKTKRGLNRKGLKLKRAKLNRKRSKWAAEGPNGQTRTGMGRGST